MKAEIRYGDFGGKVEVDNRKVDISKHNGDFGILVKELQDENLKKIYIFPGSLEMTIARSDNFEIKIGKGYYDDNQTLVVTAWYRTPNSDIKNRIYLTKHGNWLPEPKSGLLPGDALRIPIFSSIPIFDERLKKLLKKEVSENV